MENPNCTFFSGSRVAEGGRNSNFVSAGNTGVWHDFCQNSSSGEFPERARGNFAAEIILLKGPGAIHTKARHPSHRGGPVPDDDARARDHALLDGEPRDQPVLEKGRVEDTLAVHFVPGKSHLVPQSIVALAPERIPFHAHFY
jgi:hypothetical protein